MYSENCCLCLYVHLLGVASVQSLVNVDNQLVRERWEGVNLGNVHYRATFVPFCV